MDKIEALNAIYNALSNLQVLHGNRNATIHNASERRYTENKLDRAYKAYEWIKQNINN